MTPMKAIRAKCLDCCENSREVKLCPVEDCPLYMYRFGKNPKIHRDLTQEQKDEIAARMLMARNMPKS